MCKRNIILKINFLYMFLQLFNISSYAVLCLMHLISNIARLHCTYYSENVEKDNNSHLNYNCGQNVVVIAK